MPYKTIHLRRCLTMPVCRDVGRRDTSSSCSAFGRAHTPRMFDAPRHLCSTGQDIPSCGHAACGRPRVPCDTRPDLRRGTSASGSRDGGRNEGLASARTPLPKRRLTPMAELRLLMASGVYFVGTASEMPPGRPAGTNWKRGCAVVGRSGSALTTRATGMRPLPCMPWSKASFRSA